MTEQQWKGNDTVFKTYVRGKSSGDGKQPASAVKGKKNILTFEEASKNDCFGAVLNDDFIDISFDSDDLSEKFWNMTGENNWKCLILENPDNGHLHSFWKDTKHRIEKGGVDKKLACGLLADIHKGSTYIPLRVNGSDRFPPSQEDDIIQEVPDELIPVNTNISLLDLSEGEGRNDSIFKYILVLQSQLQLGRDAVIHILNNTNRFIFTEPLPDDELETITRQEAFEKPIFYKGKTFFHDVFGRYLISQNHIARIEGRLHIYQDGMYSDDVNLIFEAMRSVLPNIKKNQKSEVMDYMTDTAPRMNYSDVNLIAFRNGILNLDTMELLPFSPEYVVTNKIPWDYNPHAEDPDADAVLDRISCNDPDIRSLLEECIGYCFYRKNVIQKAFILLGDKSNGKSTFISVLNRILGNDNVSAMDLKNLGDRFSKATLFKKLANIGDDISDEFIPDASLFKKIVSGDRIQAEFKGQQLFEFNPFVKLIFSANNMPRIKDDTGAVQRRLVIIPFQAVFTEDDPDFDPDIKRKLFKQSAMEYFIKIGVAGLKKVLEQKHFTKSRKVQKELDDYNRQNHPELLFFEELEEFEVLNHETKEVYARYNAFCSENGFTAKGQAKFTEAVNKHFGTEAVPRKIAVGRGARKSVRLFLKTDYTLTTQ